MRRAVPLCLLILLSGCSRDTFRSRPLESPKAGRSPNIGSPEQVQFSSGLGVNLARMTRTPSGLYWQDLVVGTGTEAVAGSTVDVDYTGWLPDARQFDSSKNAGKPYNFVLGQGRVIAGWDQGVAGMRVGGRRLLVIPPELGYGASGAGGLIPPNATLVFVVELRDVPGQAASPPAAAQR
jgi:FKBP-type peptidyl-prolyl cis-trans isomerase FkpA